MEHRALAHVNALCVSKNDAIAIRFAASLQKVATSSLFGMHNALTRPVCKSQQFYTSFRIKFLNGF